MYVRITVINNWPALNHFQCCGGYTFHTFINTDYISNNYVSNNYISNNYVSNNYISNNYVSNACLIGLDV